MKGKNIIFLLLLSAGVAIAACKKEEAEDTSKYVLGSLNFDIPKYAAYNEIISTTPYGCHHPDCQQQKDGTFRDSLGYYFMTSYNDVKDTVKKFTDPVGSPKTFKFCIPDTLLGKVTFSAYAFAPDCYSASASKTLQVVNPGYGVGCSLTGFEYEATDPTVRIGERNYYTTIAGGSEWLRENVGLHSVGVGCSGAEVMYDIFGGYYNYDEAMGICPEGWRLPSMEDYKTLMSSVGNVGELFGDIYFNGVKMWTYWPEVKISNKTKMSIIPVGFAFKSGESFTFKDLEKRAVFWTSDSEGGFGTACYFYEGLDKMYSGTFDKLNFYASVRCIKNK